VSWVLAVAPTVLVLLGQRAVAAALEGGYEHVAQLILDAGVGTALSPPPAVHGHSPPPSGRQQMTNCTLCPQHVMFS
jgi:hypothetical protein